MLSAGRIEQRCGGVTAVSPSARVRNVAISPRVTDAPGQNRSLFGGLQPLVIPAVARAAMSATNGDSPTSTNWFASPAGRSSARVRNAAIWPRVIGDSGQKRVFAGGLQPSVMALADIASIEPSWTDPSSSVNEPPGSVGAAFATPVPPGRTSSATSVAPASNAAKRLRLVEIPIVTFIGTAEPLLEV